MPREKADQLVKMGIARYCGNASGILNGKRYRYPLIRIGRKLYKVSN